MQKWFCLFLTVGCMLLLCTSAMAKTITGSTPKQDGFRMPGEFEEQERIWMVWPERTDTYRDGAKPVQEVFVNLAAAIAEFEPVTMLVSNAQYINARTRLPENIRVLEMSNDDCWARDIGPTFLVNDKGEVRACDWKFNAWGGLVDGLYFPWDNDDKAAQKICELAGVDRYRTDDFVLEGGSIHVDGEGTLLKPFAIEALRVYIVRCRYLQGMIKNREEEQEAPDK